jgi:hypothetical protein
MVWWHPLSFYLQIVIIECSPQSHRYGSGLKPENIDKFNTFIVFKGGIS